MAADAIPELSKFLTSPWYEDITAYLLTPLAVQSWDRFRARKAEAATAKYRIEGNKLWHLNGDKTWVLYLIEEEIAEALKSAHDDRGHWFALGHHEDDGFGNFARHRRVCVLGL